MEKPRVVIHHHVHHHYHHIDIDPSKIIDGLEGFANGLEQRAAEMDLQQQTRNVNFTGKKGAQPNDRYTYGPPF